MIFFHISVKCQKVDEHLIIAANILITKRNQLNDIECANDNSTNIIVVLNIGPALNQAEEAALEVASCL